MTKIALWAAVVLLFGLFLGAIAVGQLWPALDGRTCLRQHLQVIGVKPLVMVQMCDEWSPERK